MDRKRLLIADDSEMNRAILANMLDHDFEIIEVSDGREAIAALQAYRGKLSALLLDIVMPEMDGFEVLREMKERGWIEDIPVIMISAETGSSYIDRAFELGASDYISRPFAASIVRRRIINTILLHTKKQQLMDIVSGRLCRQEKNNEIMLSILAYAMEYRSGEGGLHMQGVEYLTNLLLRRLMEKTNRYAIDHADVDVICLASSLHDIGKLMISEDILKKPGKLTDEEYAIIKQHTRIGAQIISQLPIYQNEKLVKYAIEVCRWHHERWNGEGYPDGLKGDSIPIAAQIVSLADAYDALTSERSYKQAFSHEKALAMIHNGECGSFNPLLLECLDEISGTVKQNAAKETSQEQPAIHRAVEELYRGQNLSSARTTQQIEEAYAKQDFFTRLTDEIWFEYTVQPSSILLSNGAMEQTGLSQTIVDPAEDTDFLAIVGGKTIEQMRQTLRKLPMDETYFEMTATIVLSGRPKLCRMAALIIRSVNDPSHCVSLIGRVIDIDDGCRRLESYDLSASAPTDEQLLLPITAGADGVLKLTHEQLDLVMQSYRAMFQLVRLVDPEICMQLTAGADGTAVENNDPCYSVWGKTRRCEHCISQDVVRLRKTQNKIETIGSDVYYVLAMYVEVDGFPYSLECVNPIRSDDMIGGENENLLSQLLVRNRQVYIDSATRVFNRRYYDDRLRGLRGEYAMAMIDIDNFKHINDRFGHAAGDAALYSIAQNIRSVLRSSDELVRYGGDEFFLLFHGLPEHILERKLEDICRAVRAITLPEYPGLTFSASIGGIYGIGCIADLIRKADIALYQAKTTKNRAVLYKETPHETH